MVEAANTIMVECQPHTTRIQSIPVCFRFGITAQNIEPINPPIPNEDMRIPNPTESRSNTSLVNMGTNVVWNEKPVMLNITAIRRADQSNCSPLTYLNPSATKANTDSLF